MKLIIAIIQPTKLEAVKEALSHVEEREEISRSDFTGAPNMSHEPRPEEREG